GRSESPSGARSGHGGGAAAGPGGDDRLLALHVADAARADRLHLRPDRLGLPAQLLAGPEHGQRRRLHRVPELRRRAARPGVSAVAHHNPGLHRLHRAVDLRRLARAGDARQRGELGAGHLPHRLFHPDRDLLRRCLLDLADEPLQRHPFRRGQHRHLRVVRDREPDQLDRGHRPTVVLAGAGHGPALAPGRLLHDHLHRRPAGDPALPLRGGLGRRRAERLDDVPRHHAADAAEHDDRGDAAPLHQRLPGVRRVLQRPRRHRGDTGQPRAGEAAARLPLPGRLPGRGLRARFRRRLHPDRDHHHRHRRPGPPLRLRPVGV
ncbi:MAG: ABC transporter, permease protein 1 (cluster 1, maltose/g3p/polyamine/iron), partial [uncultured Thermomicrobiales bacterium]